MFDSISESFHTECNFIDSVCFFSQSLIIQFLVLHISGLKKLGCNEITKVVFVSLSGKVQFFQLLLEFLSMKHAEHRFSHINTFQHHQIQMDRAKSLI